jgi:hypothetical protein
VDSRSKAVVAVVAVVVLLASLFGCLGLAGLLLWAEREAELVEAGPTIDDGVDVDGDGVVDPLGVSTPDDPAAREAEMRRRYRPGPYVRVEGMLPSGRLEVNRMHSGDRFGRTVDTPWVVAGAELHPEAAPPASAGGAPRIRLEGGKLTVLAGVPSELPLHTDPGDGAEGDVRGLYIAFHDYPGHFFLPATVDTELGHVQVAGVEDARLVFGLDAALMPDGRPITTPYTVTMYVAAVDVAGRISEYRTSPLEVQPVGNGDVEVALTMTEATDLDLYVVDPAGVTVYYGNTESFSRGHLDLDANAACSSNMGTNAEHVFWPSGTAPAGTYTVRVAHYQSCISGRPVDYRITVRNCGETAVFAGRFEGEGNSTSCDTPPGDDRSWCQAVVEFEVTPCEGATPALPDKQNAPGAPVPVPMPRGGRVM